VNAVDVVYEAEQPRSRRGGQDVVAKRGKKEKNSLPASLFNGSCPRCRRRRLGGEWRRQKIRCGEGSRYATQWKLMTKMPPPPGRRGTGEQDAAAAPPGRRGTKGSRATKSTAAEELAPVLGEVAENRSIRGFRSLSYICICANPLGFFLSSALPGICLYVQLYWVLAESVVPLLSLLSLWYPESLAVLPNETAVHR
jgi:hypothetical protein